MGPEHVEIQQYTNKIVTSVGFHAIHTHFVFNNAFFEERTLYEIMWKKYGIVGQATDDSMAHARCMLDN